MRVTIGTAFIGLLLFANPVQAEEQVLEVPADGLSLTTSGRGMDWFPRRSDWRWYELSTHWYFHSGDDDRWADPEFDEASWARLDSIGTLLLPSTQADIGWDGVGWFRLHFRVPPTLLKQSLALMWTQRGASEIYLDGKLIRSLGSVGVSSHDEECLRFDPGWPEVIPVHLGDRSDHVIAVRYSNFRRMDRPRWLADPEADIPGFVARLVESGVGIDYTVKSTRLSTVNQMLFAVPLAFAVLHFFMFLFFRDLKGNLYYALFAASLSFLMYGPLQAGRAADPDVAWYLTQLSEVASILTVLFSLRFLHHELLGKSPRFFRWLAAICLLVMVFCWIIPLNVVYVFFAVALFPEPRRGDVRPPGTEFCPHQSKPGGAAGAGEGAVGAGVGAGAASTGGGSCAQGTGSRERQKERRTRTGPQAAEAHGRTGRDEPGTA
jgi:hypothetical protein